MIDSHAHIYASEFDLDLNQVIMNAKEAGVTGILLPNIDLESIPAMFKVVETYVDYCFPMLGLHPCYIGENPKKTLDAIEHIISEHAIVGIGEIGLDYYWNKENIALQHYALMRQCEWALALNLPVALHTRDANADVIKIIKPFAQRGLKGVFHCFSGSYEEAQEIIDFGFYLGIGGVVTYKNAKLPDVLSKISINNILLETDAPYLPPVPFRGKRNEPAYLKEIVAKLQQVYFLTFNEIKTITTANTLALFTNANR